MATTRYTLMGAGANFMDFYIPYGDLSLDGQEIVFKGNSGIDEVYVGSGSGLTFDFTQAGLNTDTIYLAGGWADYARNYSGSVVTFSRLSGGSEVIKAISGDNLVFADGTVSVLEALNFLKGTAAEPLPAGETSTAFPLSVSGPLNNTVRAVVLDSTGETLALPRAGVTLIVKGGSGVDVVYATPGASVDGSLLGLGQDKIYLAGNWSEYGGALTGSVVTLTRTVGEHTESVKFLGGSASAYDSIVFADGATRSVDILNFLNTGSAVTLDPSACTPLPASPVIQSMTSSGNQMVLTYDSSLDAGSAPAPESFTVMVGAAANAVTNVAVASNTVTLTLTGTVPTGAAVQVSYTAPAAGSGAAIQDLAGNIAADFTTGMVADGYIRDAQIYIDTNGNGNADANEALGGVTTDYHGNFFLPTNTPAGAIIAVGGVNIDTGVANTMPLTAPAGSVMVSPLTTLVQAYLTANAGADVASASTAVATALGLPGDTELTSYNPIAALTVDANDATALVVQKAAVQVATLVTMAASAPTGVSSAETANTVAANLVAQMGSPTNINTVNLADSTVIAAALGASSSADAATIGAANTALGNATSLTDLSTTQATFLDTAHASLFDYFARAAAFMATGSLEVTDWTMGQVKSTLADAYEGGTKYLAYLTSPSLDISDAFLLGTTNIGPGVGITALFDLADLEEITTEGRGGYAGNLYGQVTTWINAEGSLFGLDAGYSPIGVIEMEANDRYAPDPTQQWDLSLASVTFAGLTLSTDGGLDGISAPTSAGISLLDFSVNVSRFEVDYESLSQSITSVFSQSSPTSIADNLINSFSAIADSFRWFTPSDGIAGTGAKDTLYGTSGNDVLYGNGGDDDLYGGSGNDTYRYLRDEGADRIFESGNGLDVLEIWDNASMVDLDNFNDLRFMRSGADLVISLDIEGAFGTSDFGSGQITLMGQTSPASRVDFLHLYDDDGAMVAGPIDLASVWGAAGNTLSTLAFTGDNTNGYRAVDSRAPALSGVALTGNAGTDHTYAVGDTVLVTATFDEDVTVDFTGGFPSLTIGVGAADRAATYVSQSGPNSLAFAYIVAPGDLDPDGISIAADSLTLNGGVIEDESHNQALLSHAALADNAGHLVDGGSLAGVAVIDLGIYGRLIEPVQVDGKWFYYWDRSGDGTSTNTGSLNGGADYTTDDVLNDIFTEDVNGNVNPGSNTTDTYRYATLNGVRLALPTQGDRSSNISSGYNLADNQNYTDLAEIWDTHSSGYNTAGVPSGWGAGGYWSSTPSSSGHAFIALGNGFIGEYDYYDNGYDYVAVEVTSTYQTHLPSISLGDGKGYLINGIQFVDGNSENQTWYIWSMADDGTYDGVSHDWLRDNLGFGDAAEYLAVDNPDTMTLNGITIQLPRMTDTPGWSGGSGAGQMDYEMKDLWHYGDGDSQVDNWAAADFAATGWADGWYWSSQAYNSNYHEQGRLLDGFVPCEDGSDDSVSSTVGVGIGDINVVGFRVLSTPTPSTAGDTVIDLGSYGKLIAPVQVDGKWFYFWDRSGDGIANYDGGALNGGHDYTTHNVLDGIFTEDINGNANPGSDTTDTYRYATLNGVRLALPTDGDGTTTINYYLADNQNYTDLAEIWDTHNSGFQSTGTPSGWGDDVYWSATPSGSGHAEVNLYLGYVADGFVLNNAFVALAVL